MVVVWLHWGDSSSWAMASTCILCNQTTAGIWFLCVHANKLINYKSSLRTLSEVGVSIRPWAFFLHPQLFTLKLSLAGRYLTFTYLFSFNTPTPPRWALFILCFLFLFWLPTYFTLLLLAPPLLFQPLNTFNLLSSSLICHSIHPTLPSLSAPISFCLPSSSSCWLVWRIHSRIFVFLPLNSSYTFEQLYVCWVCTPI